MSLPELEHLELKREGAILIATISRPEALNALNKRALESLGALARYLVTDFETRVLILTGKGEKAFVAGADIKGFEAMDAHAAEIFSRQGQAVFSLLESLPQPVIAAVNGFALGGGLELALACDMVVASEKARFALPECKLGLIPGFGGTVRLPRLVGTAKAMEMALTGAMIWAAEAKEIGLVVKVVPPAEVLNASIAMARAMLACAPVALALIKRSMQVGRGLGVATALELEAGLFGEVFKTQDKTEGVRAFQEGREPKFSGK